MQVPGLARDGIGLVVLEDRSVVDQAGDRPDGLGGRRDQGGRRFLVVKVRPNCYRPTALGLDLGGKIASGSLGGMIVHGDSPTMCREVGCDRPADTPGRAGNEGDSWGQILHARRMNNRRPRIKASDVSAAGLPTPCGKALRFKDQKRDVGRITDEKRDAHRSAEPEPEDQKR